MQAVDATCLHSRDGRNLPLLFFIFFAGAHAKRKKTISFSARMGAKKRRYTFMASFFNSAVTVLRTLVVALGAGLGIWGAINLLEGYGNDNRATRS